jgi:hypothetical protein
LDDDSSLPSQFGDPEQLKTPFGEFIVRNKIFCNGIENDQGCAYAGIFPGARMYDVDIAFPSFGHMNTWYAHTPPYQVNVFDTLGNILTDLEVYKEAVMGTDCEDDGYQAWSTELQMDWKDIRCWYFFKSLQAAEGKLKSILPTTVYYQMNDAYRETQEPDES